MRNSQYYLYLFALFLFTQAMGLSEELSAGEWSEIPSQNNVTVFAKRSGRDAKQIIKANGTILRPLNEVLGVFQDVNLASDWIPFLGEREILKHVSPTKLIVYTHIKTPFIFQDRYFIDQSEYEILPDGGYRFTMRSVPNPADFRVEPGKVLAVNYKTMFQFTPVDGGAHTRLDLEIDVDPRGNIPTWAVEKFQAFWPQQVIVGLRQEIEKLRSMRSASLTPDHR